MVQASHTVHWSMICVCCSQRSHHQVQPLGALAVLCYSWSVLGLHWLALGGKIHVPVKVSLSTVLLLLLLLLFHIYVYISFISLVIHRYNYVCTHIHMHEIMHINIDIKCTATQMLKCMHIYTLTCTRTYPSFHPSIHLLFLLSCMWPPYMQLHNNWPVLPTALLRSRHGNISPPYKVR